MGSQGHENLKPFQPKFQPKRLEEPLLCGGDMYGAFKISAHLFLSSLSFGECRHKVLVSLVFFMAIRHVMAVVAILQQRP
jgi:hypothetical protein